jgi:hypothetical protein
MQKLSKKHKKKLLGAWNQEFSGSLFETLPEQSTTLFLGLEHPEMDVRIQALKRLAELLNQEKPDLEKVQFVGSTLVRRLEGSSKEVRQVLKLKNLRSICEPHELLETLMRLVLSTSESEVRLKAVRLSLDIITHHPNLISEGIKQKLLGSLLQIQVDTVDVERKGYRFNRERHAIQVPAGRYKKGER